MKTRIPNLRSGSRGFNLFEAMVVTCVMAVLITLWLPVLTRPRGCVLRTNCNSNLNEIGLAFKQWALDHDDKYPVRTSTTNGGTMELVRYGFAWPHFQVLSNELNTPKILVCPQDTRRQIAPSFASNFNNSAISYFVGADAADTHPSMFLAGDRNITNRLGLRSGLVAWTTNEVVGWTHQLHRLQGNVALADGSVQDFSTIRLRVAFQDSGVATNRLLMP